MHKIMFERKFKGYTINNFTLYKIEYQVMRFQQALLDGVVI